MVFEMSFRREQSDRLTDEQWVPGRLAPDSRNQVVVRGVASALAG